MKYALVNPRWTFEGSVYFGCREPHLPLEYGYARALLEADGHEVLVVDAQAEALDDAELRRRVALFRPDLTVITSAPSYLFWRCAPPELRVPRHAADLLRREGGTLVAVGPHASTTPAATLRKLEVELAVLGECEEVLRELGRADFDDVRSIAYRKDGQVVVRGGPHASDMAALPALRWPDRDVARHAHHHHRFDRPPDGPGAELESTRGCPYHCTFCAKDNFRNGYRKRPLPTVLAELDGLVAQGVEYVYFVDEIFLPNPELLEALAERPVLFGVQTRLDLWSEPLIDLLGEAGCVSIEAGVESVTPEGRDRLAKRCRIDTASLESKLLRARRTVPFVQANLLECEDDDPREVERFRERLQAHGVWSNDPVPLFPYPGSPDYTARWGAPDDRAWERAVEHYLGTFSEFSEIQEERPVPLKILEGGCGR